MVQEMVASDEREALVDLDAPSNRRSPFQKMGLLMSGFVLLATVFAVVLLICRQHIQPVTPFDENGPVMLGLQCKDWCTEKGCPDEPKKCGACDFCSAAASDDSASSTSGKCKNWCEKGGCTTHADDCGGCSICTADMDEWMQIHNKYRCMHGDESLSWNADLAAHAQEYADGLAKKCADGGSCAMTHSKNPSSFETDPPLGPAAENIAKEGKGAPPDIKRIVGAWYDEVNDCKPKSDTEYENGCMYSDHRSNHFTALIWKGATDVGCGYSTLEDADRFYVCWYKGPCTKENPTSFLDCLSVDTPNIEQAYSSMVIPPQQASDECEAKR